MKEPLQPHSLVFKPWFKVGIDIFQLFNQNYLIIVDYFSKYPEVISLNNNLTAQNIITKMKSIFARHGIPKIVISDNAKQFNSLDYKNFASDWDFEIKLSSPHHQQSNGFAERTIQTIKSIFNKCIENKEDIYLALLSFRNTPIFGSKYSPSEILMSRLLRDNLPLIETKLNSKLIEKK